MKTLTHRDLRNNSGAVLRDVAAGESYEITNRGKVVAHLTPPADQVQSGLRPLTTARTVRYADLPRHAASETTTEGIDALRDER